MSRQWPSCRHDSSSSGVYSSYSSSRADSSSTAISIIRTVNDGVSLADTFFAKVTSIDNTLETCMPYYILRQTRVKAVQYYVKYDINCSAHMLQVGKLSDLDGDLSRS